jgi:hypothetical protein
MQENAMALALTLRSEQIQTLLAAIDTQITALEVGKPRPPAHDAANDTDQDDVAQLRALREELHRALEEGDDTATRYESWFDPADSGLCLLRQQDVAQARALGQLSDQARLLYRFIAHTGEEAMAIHTLRQGWAPYLPMGEAAPCPTCSANYYSQGYGDCWRCGHIG